MKPHPRSEAPRRARRGAWFALALALLAAGAPRPADAVQVTTGAGSGLAGQTVDITLSTGNLTGLGIVSLQFDLTYFANRVTAVDVIEAGTSVGAAGWGDATFNVTSGKISVSHAGTTPLTGSGPLLVIRFLVNPAQLAASSTPLTLSNFVFNEGVPNDTTTNNTLTIPATPIITVSPNTAEIVRGNTQSFTVSGTVTNPVTWATTNPAIATVTGGGLLTGVAPGEVRVFAVDAATRRDTTDQDVFVRGMSLTPGTLTTTLGQSFSLPINVSSLTGLGIRSGQFSLSFSGGRIGATGVSTPPGTLLNGYGPVAFGSTANTATVDFAGASDLSGSGILCYVTFDALTSGGVTVVPTSALFNEVLPAKLTNGTVTVSPLPTITVSPENVTLLAGQTQAFTLGGSPTPPITWSTLDPAVATISPGGLLTAVAGGVTKVRAQDALGAVDLNGSVTVYDFKVTLATVNAPPGATVRVPFLLDRDISALGAHSLQYTVTYNGTHVLQSRSLHEGLVSVWDPNIVTNVHPTSIVVAEGGVATLGSGNGELDVLEFDLSPSVPVGTNLPLTVLGMTFNEGLPSPQVVNGMIQVRTNADAPGAEAPRLAFAAPWPNPAHGAVRLRLSLPEADAGACVRIVGVDGRLVRRLDLAASDAGAGETLWDGLDTAGRRARPGLYFATLEWRGERLTRRFALVR